MGSKVTVKHNPPTLFLRLVRLGLQHLTDGEPRVLFEGTFEEAGFLSETGWPVVAEPSAGALSLRAAELSTQGAVLLIPSWERIAKESGRRGRFTQFRYEDTLSYLRPHDANSSIAVLLPAAALVSEAPMAAATREAVAQSWDTVAVLYGQGALPSIHHSFITAALFLRARQSVTPPMRIYRTPLRGESAAIEADFRQLLQRDGGRVDHGYILRSIPEPHVGLDFNRHDPVILVRRDSLADFGKVVSLGDLYEFPSSVHITEIDNTKGQCGANDIGATRLLRGREVGSNGLIIPPDEQTQWVKIPEERLLAAGDLVMRSIYGHGDPGGLIVAPVNISDLPAAASDMVIVLRPRTVLTSRQIEFATMFLRTPLARTLAGVTGLHVRRSALAKLPIPQPDQDLAEALDDLTLAKEHLESWRAEAENLLQSVFLDETPAAARARVIESGRALRLKVEAASLLDDLGYTVRTRFPYPIAARWREAEALQSAEPSTEAYGAVLETAEILLCYAALLALALSREEGIELGAVQAVKEKLKRGSSGPGMGDWAAILLETATSRKFRSLPSTHPLNDLRGLLSSKDAEAARQRLSQRRNDQAHLRRVDQLDLPSAIYASFEDLKVLVDAARFLTDWPLVQVTGVRWDSLARTARIDYRELMGDHPVVPTKTEWHPDNDLEIGSLYLRGHERRLHLLRPFLTSQVCPVCRVWSVFHVDRTPNASVTLKSLENGHIAENALLIHAVRAVGLL
ncbi:hypothetical protein ABZU75_04465 [Streptosporangium sp. NPDC005286]|uniref:hypothetical protein n=1 Tax=Streptosporangium sp. NPDC005286 TaxID=3154463 RepID=UPI0033B49F00